jgi:hypothetical protein
LEWFVPNVKHLDFFVCFVHKGLLRAHIESNSIINETLNLAFKYRGCLIPHINDLGLNFLYWIEYHIHVHLRLINLLK